MIRFARMMVAAAWVAAGVARAQAPDEEWKSAPSAPAAVPVPADPEPLPPPPPPPPPEVTRPATPSGRVTPRPEVLARARPVLPRNEVSMLGGNSLGAGKRGQTVMLGFPLLSIRALFGLVDSFDLGIGFDSYYFLMNEPRAVIRFSFLRTSHWGLAATLEGGYAFFAQRASRETRGARWLTGRRNINVSPAIVASYQGSAPRAARFFGEIRYLLAFDTEPFASDPLVGVPSALIVGHNGGITIGAELPLSAQTSFVFSLGLLFHGRPSDSPAMPSGSIGIVTSL